MVLQLRYSYGIKLLARADTILQPEGNAEERTPLLENGTTLTSPPSSSTLASDIEGYDESDCQDPIRPLKNHNASSLFPPANRNKFYNSFPNSPNDSRPVLPRYDSVSDTEEAATVIILPTHSRSSSKHYSCLHHAWRHIARAGAVLNRFMTVPLWAALMSLMVACIEPLKHALLNHLQPVDNAIANAGKCSVPLTLVVLGAYFHVPDDESTTRTRTFMQFIRDMRRHLFSRRKSYCLPPSPSPLESESKPGETKTIVLGIASRMIITPVLLVPGLALATKYGGHEVFQE